MGKISTIGIEEARVQKPPAQSAAESKRLEVRLKVFPFRCFRYLLEPRAFGRRSLTLGVLPQMVKYFPMSLCRFYLLYVFFPCFWFTRIRIFLVYFSFFFWFVDGRIANRVVDSSVSIRFRVMALSDESKCVCVCVLHSWIPPFRWRFFVFGCWWLDAHRARDTRLSLSRMYLVYLHIA